MKPKQSTVAVQSTIQGTDIQMRIDDSALTHIMGVLTDLYGDPEMAIIREYSTNALDSHIAAGVKRPIEVTTPSPLHPVFEIRDYGLGLDADDIEQIYSAYGVSTKRDSDDAIGMLGLGCKSALAYGDQFTLIGFKNGVRTAVVVSRDAQGTGTMTILEEAATEEPNGVQVIIPAKQHNQIADKAAAFFAFWEPGTVLLDGSEPEPLKGYELSKTMLVVNANSITHAFNYGIDHNAYVVMGNVAYPAHLPDLGLPEGRVLVARVPIGAVQFAPSRESLQDTAFTRKTLKDLADEFNRKADKAVARDVAKAKTSQEAARIAVKVSSSLGRSPEASWRGKKIPAKLTFPEDEAPMYLELRWRAYRSGSRVNGEPTENLKLRKALEATWVLNFTNKTFYSPMTQKLNRYCEVEGIKTPDVVLLAKNDELPYSEWLEGVQVIDWKDVRKWRDPEAKEIRAAGSYEALVTEGQAGCKGAHVKADEIDTSKALIYTMSDDESAQFHPETHRLLQEVVGDCTLVRLTKPRLAKFLRIFPDAKEARQVLAKEARQWWGSLDESKRIAIAIHGRRSDRHTQTIAAMNADSLMMLCDHADRVADPELRTALTTRQDYREMGMTGELREWVKRSAFISEDELDAIHVSQLELGERYPLVLCGIRERAERRTQEHFLAYVNAVYNEGIE